MNPSPPILIIAHSIPSVPKGSFFFEWWATTWEIIPNPGRIKIYTSGCPKNQNRCWNRMGSPPPTGSKKVVFRFRSVRSMVIAPASTGRAATKRQEVIATDHTNNGRWSGSTFSGRRLMNVDTKLIPPRMDEAPARCSETIARSIAIPGWPRNLDRGG
jgi:hypothetical protein